MIDASNYISGTGGGSGPAETAGGGGNSNVETGFSGPETANGDSAAGQTGLTANDARSDALTAADDITGSGRRPGIREAGTGTGSGESSALHWKYFNEASYVAAGGLKPGEDAYKRNKFNQEASDRLASNRDIPDTRNQQCRGTDWQDGRARKFPATSVIITFHNEARSTLLRTIVR